MPRVRVQAAGEEVEPAGIEGRTFRFVDLPSTVSLTVSVVGLGLAPFWQEIGAVKAGGSLAVDLSPEVVGTGTLSIAEGKGDVAATLLLLSGDRPLRPGSSAEVTAGSVSVRVQSESDEAVVSIPVERGATVVFDPRPHAPSSLTVVGLPVGADLRVFVESPAGVIQELEGAVPASVDTVDEATGVQLAAPVQLPGVLGGSGGLFVRHPALGEGMHELVLEPGGVNAITFDWSDMPGVSRVQASWEQWRAERALATAEANRALGLSAVVAGVGAAVAAVGFVGSGVAASDLSARQAELESLAIDGVTSAELGSYSDAAGAAGGHRDQARVMTGLGIAGSVTAGVGIGFVIGHASQRSRRLSEGGAWSMPVEGEE